MLWGFGAATSRNSMRRCPLLGRPFLLYLQSIPIGFLLASLLGLPYRILNINHKEELLRILWVNPKP